MAIKPPSDRSTLPIGIGVLTVVALVVAWLVFQGAPFVLGCVVMLALTGSELALLVRSDER